MAACASLCTLCVTSAEAVRAKPASCDSADIMRPCGSFQLDQPGHSSAAHRTRLDRGAAAAIGLTARMLSRPSGCPRWAFCGCARVWRWPAARYGTYSWGPPTGCASLALRRHLRWWRRARARLHVASAHQRLDLAGLRCEFRPPADHARSIAGFSIVNPHGAG